MKIFISADIEGTAGILSWDEAERTHADYVQFRELMTAEVLAACAGHRRPVRPKSSSRTRMTAGATFFSNRCPPACVSCVAGPGTRTR